MGLMLNRRLYRIILPLLVLSLLAAAGCRESARTTPAPDLQITLDYEPRTPVVGEATFIVTLRDAAGQIVTNAAVSVRGDMNHAGMVPVLAEAEPPEDGVYRVPFQWTMGGDWVVTVVATLPDGTAVTRTFDFTVGS